MSLPCRITALIAVVGATAAAATTVRTPFGDVHRSCVLRVPSGSTVGEAADGRSVTITYANGTAATLPACAAAPAASYAVVVARRRPQDAPVGDAPVGGAANPPTWKGWPFHLWFGAAYATFTKPALIGDIIEMNTTWLVPARPTNTRGNASDPWGGHAPTLSTWIGVQGGAVLQPVLEWNGLVAGDFDISSWNCCPAGYVVHSDPVGGLRPGDVLLGSVRQSAADNDVFTVTSTLARAGVPPVTTSLAADMRGVAGWKPQWAEAIVETYSVTSCAQVPCGAPMADFVNISLTTTANGTIARVPWTSFYEVESEGRSGTPICAGATALGGVDNSLNITFSC